MLMFIIAVLLASREISNFQEKATLKEEKKSKYQRYLPSLIIDAVVELQTSSLEQQLLLQRYFDGNLPSTPTPKAILTNTSVSSSLNYFFDFIEDPIVRSEVLIIIKELLQIKSALFPFETEYYTLRDIISFGYSTNTA